MVEPPDGSDAVKVTLLPSHAAWFSTEEVPVMASLTVTGTVATED